MKRARDNNGDSEETPSKRKQPDKPSGSSTSPEGVQESPEARQARVALAQRHFLHQSGNFEVPCSNGAAAARDSSAPVSRPNSHNPLPAVVPELFGPSQSSPTSSSSMSSCQGETQNNGVSSSNLGSTRPRASHPKDDSYWEKRRKNNESARRSRESRRCKELQVDIYRSRLWSENVQYSGLIKDNERLILTLETRLFGKRLYDPHSSLEDLNQSNNLLECLLDQMMKTDENGDLLFAPLPAHQNHRKGPPPPPPPPPSAGAAGIV